MFPRPAFDYLFLGVIQLELQGIQPGAPVRTDDATGAADRLDWYLGALANLGLSTTLTAAWELQNVRDRLNALPPGSLLPEAEANLIRTTTLMLREALKAEARNLTVYEVSGKRFDTRALLHDLPSLMRPGSYGQLPHIAAIDLHEAAICIAFDRATAAAFHSVRATEAVLRHYYSCIVVRNRIKGPWLWGPMVTELQKPRRARQPDPAVVEHLDTFASGSAILRSIRRRSTTSKRLRTFSVSACPSSNR
jgi:hypothetical protein